MHSVETCDQRKILAHNIFETLLPIVFKKKLPTWISQLGYVWLTLSHFPVQDHDLVFHSWKFGFLQSSSFWNSCTLKMVVFWHASINRLEIWHISYNGLKHFRELSLDLGPNECIIKNLFMTRKHLNIAVTLYLEDSTLCNRLVIIIQ